MLNYLLIYYPTTNLNLQTMHLLEHVISKKLTYIIDMKYRNSGLIVTSETFLDGIEITIFSPHEENLRKLISVLNNLTISEGDWDIIKIESARINKEVMVNDVSDEEEIIYSSLKYIGENIHKLYKKIEINPYTIKELQIAIQNKAIILSNETTFFKIETCSYKKIQNRILESSKHQGYNIGIVQRNIANPISIIESLFFSFIFGSIDDSLLKKIYYSNKSDYQFLEISFPYYNTDLSLFMADGKCKKNFKNSIKEEMVEFMDNDNPFRTYSLLYDPHYLEFSKRLVRYNGENDIIKKR